VSVLALKRRREIRGQRWQFLSAGLTVLLGVMLFAASYDAYRNLRTSYEATYDRLAFADMTITGGATLLADDLAALDGVAAVTTRTQADTPLRIDDTTLSGRLVGLPKEGQPDVDALDMTEGSIDDVRPDPASGVAETHLAQAYELEPGDGIEVLTAQGFAPLELVGVAVSPEYLWPAPSRQEVFVPAGEFGVVFVDESLLAGLPDTVVSRQTLVLYEADVDRDQMDEAVVAMARDAGATDTMTQAEHPSNSTLQLDVTGFEQMAVAFPALFLTAAGMAVYVLLTRVVLSQRGIIGTLLASGLDRRTIRNHYLGFGIRLGLVGALVGVVLGTAAGYALPGVYTTELGIPDTVVQIRPLTMVIGLVFGVVAGAVSAWIPARSAFRMAPAEAMRGAPPSAAGRRTLLERVLPSRMSARARMTLRGISRNTRRSLATVLGVVLALTLILAAWGMIDTIVLVLDEQFEDVAVQDAEVVLSAPLDDTHVDAVAGVTGVAASEPVASLAVTVRATDDDYATSLTAYESGTVMHGWENASETLPASGVTLGSALRDQLAIGDTDTVTLHFTTLDVDVVAAVSGFVDEPVGTFAYADRAWLQTTLESAGAPDRVLDQPGVGRVAARFDPRVDREAVLADIGEIADVGAVVDSRSLYLQIKDYLGLFYVFVGIMLVFGGAMAFALMFNTISVNIAERSGELATLRANGMSSAMLGRMMAGENLLLTAIGIVPGLVVGYLVAAAMMASYSSDAFSLDLRLRPWTLPLAALAVLVVAGISMWPSLRRLRSMDLGTVVRERAI
jgi:putative ABC transport system permease protein